MRRFLVIHFFLLVLGVAGLRADLPLPPQVLDPQTAAEAWNVIRLSTANVSRLLKEQRLDEVAQQISLCSPALRALARAAGSPEQRPLVDEQTTLAFRLVNDIAQAGMARLQQSSEAAFDRLQKALVALRPAFAAADLQAEIYTCPLHPEMVTPQTGVQCRFCGGPLRIRRIPYTDLYAVPEAPQTRLVLEPEGVLSAGTGVTLSGVLQTSAGMPLELSRLIPYHAAPLRLLLVDATLTDFHLVTPAREDAPGHFKGSFTPATAGPYRVWAEAVPEQTAIPEYPAADLGGEFKAMDRTRHAFVESLKATAEGLTFELGFTGVNGGAPRAGQVSMLRLQITDAAQQPVTRLEPFMNAFAHLTGIYDDARTILRLHPAGGDILREDLRGGPSLAFKIYPPRAGFIRFFCQVRVDGRVITVPLGVQVGP